MANEVDYDSLKERLYSNSREVVSEDLKKEKNLRYRPIRERIRGSNPKFPPAKKSDLIVYYLGAPKNLWDNRLTTFIEDHSEKEAKQIAKKMIENYTKRDIEEVIINELHELDSEGIQLNAGGERSMHYKKTPMTKYSDIDDRVSEFGESFDTMRKLDTLLSNKRFLKKYGITSDEIQRYEETFKKRVDRVLNNAVRFAKKEDTKEMTMKMLDYAKREGLIKHKRTGLEKAITVISLGSMVFGIAIGYPALTGNAIADVVPGSLVHGSALFFVGLVGVFLANKK